MDRSLFALLNLGLIFATAFVGVWAYRRTDPDLSRMRGSKLLGPAARGWYFSNLEPFEALFARLGVRPMTITYGQLLVSVLCAIAYANGLIYCAGFLLLAAGTLDILDGKLARRTGWASRRGAFLDSVVDRYSEFIVYSGVMVFFQPRWPVWVSLLAMLGGQMVSYTRARAEGLGQECEIGLLQRPERFVILGIGSVCSSVWMQVAGGGHDFLIGVLVLVAIFSNLTALQRLRYVSRQLRAADDPAEGDG
jgi:CDP-diacylglycerol--glycerol-3-phosphate 3-phosphatidyltransferase